MEKFSVYDNPLKVGFLNKNCVNASIEINPEIIRMFTISYLHDPNKEKICHYDVQIHIDISGVCLIVT